jgi:hypothetical protein
VLQQYFGDTLQDLFALLATRQRRVPSVAAAHLRLPARQHRAHLPEHVCAVHVRSRAGGLLGARRFVIFYLVCVLAAALTQLAVEGSGGPQPPVPRPPAEFLVCCWRSPVLPEAAPDPDPDPDPLPAWLFVTLYALVELIFGITGTEQGSPTSPISGHAQGALCILHWRARRRFSL